MKKLALLLALALTSNAFADGLYLPNLKQYATGTDLGSGKRGIDISGTVTATFSEQATATNGTALPAQTKVASGYDGTNVRVLKTDSTGQLQVGVTSTVLPTGAATSTNQTTGNTSLSSIDGKLTTTVNGLKVDGSAVVQPISASALPLPAGAATATNQTSGNSTLSAISGQLPSSLGQKAMASSMAVTIASDQAAIPITGSITASNPSVSTTGAAVPTSATMVGGSDGTNLKALKVSTTGVLSVDGSGVTQPVSGTVTVGALPALPTGSNTIGAVTQASGPWTVNQTQVGGSAITLGSKTSANSFPTVIASDQGAIPTKSPLNSTGSTVSNNTITTTASTITAASNSVEVLVQASDANTANLRVAIGTTCSSSLGIQLQAGRAETFHTSQNLSVCSESGTQGVNVQWLAQ